MSSIVKVDTIQENTSANGITVDGLNIKDSKLVTANSVVNGNITTDAVTVDKLNLISTSSVPSLEAKGDGSSQDGYIQLNCSQNSHGIKLKSPAHSANASYTLTFPVNDGDANQVLTTNGSGVLSFTTPASAANTPAFQAERNATQSISNNTETKIVCNNEIFDTDSAYDHSSSGRFTPQTEGKYLINGGFRLSSFTTGRVVSWIRKNGNQDHAVNEHYGDSSGTTQSVLSTAIITFNGSSDYVELYCYQGSGSSKNAQGDRATFFGGFKLIGV